MSNTGSRIAAMVLVLSGAFCCRSESSAQSVAAPTASLQRADYTARLVGYAVSDAAGGPRAFVNGAPPRPGRPLGPTLLGHAELSVSPIERGETICSLQGMQLAVGEAQWESGQPATIGIDEHGATVLHVPADETALRFEWSLGGERTPDGCLFRLHFPRSSLQRLTLLLAEGLVPLLPGAVVEGPYPTEEPQWMRWHIGVTSQAGALLHVFRSDVLDRDSQILVAQSTHFDLSQAGVQWRVRFQLHVLHRPVESLRFVVDGEVQIHEATLSQSGPVPGLFQSMPLSGATESPGEWAVELPDPLSGSAQIVLRGTTPLVTEARWQLPRIRLAEGMWQQGSVELSVRDPLVLTALDAQQGRQTVSEVTVREGPGERHALQLHDSDGRISIRLDLKKPDLRCRTADRLEWSADAVALTSYGDWSTQSGQVFRVQYDVPPGWDIVNVEAQGRADAGDWQPQPALLRDWSVMPSGEAPRVLEIQLTQPVSAQSPVRLVVAARRGVRTETLPLSELLQFRARGVRSRELLALSAVGPFGIHAEGLPEPLRVGSDEPELDDWPEAIPEPARRFVIRKQRRGSGATLRLLPQRANHEATVEVRAARFADALIETLFLHCDPAGSRPLRRVLVYFPVGSGDRFQWRLPRRVAPDSPAPLRRRRLRPELHELWGLPLNGELWEVLLPQAHSHRVTLVAQRRRAAEESYEIALPTLPEANQVAGQVSVASTDAGRLELTHEELTLLAGPTATALRESSRMAHTVASTSAASAAGAEDDRLKQVGIWSYGSVNARLRLGWHGSRPVAPRFDPTDHPQAVCPYALVETTAQLDGPTETRISYWLLSHGTQDVRLRLPRLSRLREVAINGRALDPGSDAAEPGQLVVALERSDALQTLSVRYRSTPARAAALATWLPCPVPRVSVPLPDVNFSVAAVQWGVLLPDDVRAVTVPPALKLQRASGARSWSQRLFGPLGRAAGTVPFDPWSREHWQSMLDPASGVPAWAPGGEVPLAAPPGSPPEARRLATLPPGWQRVWLATTLAPPELSLSVVRTASLHLMAIASLLLGVASGLVVWRMLPRSRVVLVPFVLAVSWSFALALPEALSVLGADLALGVLVAASWEGLRRRPATGGDDVTGSTVRQFAVTASVVALSGLLVPVVLPATVLGQPVRAAPRHGWLVSMQRSTASQETPSGQSDSARSIGARSDERAAVATRVTQFDRAQLEGDEVPVRPTYVLSGGRYDATLVDGHVKMTVVYDVLVFDSRDGAAVRVRLPLDPKRAGLLPGAQCKRNGESVPVAIVAEQGVLEIRLTEAGEYELRLELAPLWSAHDSDQVLRWRCPIPPLPQGRLRMKVPLGEGQVELIGAHGAVLRSQTENGTTLEAGLGSASELWLERRTAPREPHVQVNEAFVLDLASPPVLHGWFRYQVSGGAVEQLYLALESGMRAPSVSSGGTPLDVTPLPVPRGAAAVVAVKLGQRRSGTIVLHAEMPLERFQAARPVGRLRIPLVFSRLVDQRDGLFGVSYSNRLIVRLARADDVQIVPQSRFAEMVNDWGSSQLRTMAERVGLAVSWAPRVGTVELAIRPADALPRAEQTLAVEVHPDELGLEFQAVITPDQASGYQHRLRLSPEIEVEEVIVEPQALTLLRRWQRNASEPGEVTLFLRESLSTRHTIRLRGFVPGKVAGASLPSVELMGVETDENYVVLYAGPAIGAGLESLENLTQVPEYRGVPTQSSEGAPLRAVYRVVESDYSATIKVGSSPEAGLQDEPLSGENAGEPEESLAVNPSAEPASGAAVPQPAPTAPATIPSAEQDIRARPPAGKAIVLLADAVYSLGDTGRYVAQVTYWLASVPSGEIVFRLPGREREIIAATVGASTADVTRDDSGRYRVVLPAAHLPETIVLRWQGTLDWPVALGDVRLPAPQLESAEVRQTIWNLHWPPQRRRWTPIEGAQSVDAATRDAARLEALLQQAQALVDYRPELPEVFLNDRLERLLNAFAALAKQLPVAVERSKRSNVETAHLRNLMDRARSLAESRLLTVSWSSPADPWPVVPALLGGAVLHGVPPETEAVTYAVASSGQPGPTVKIRVVAHPWLKTLETIAAIAALWLSALIASIVCRTRWFHAAAAARNVILLAILGFIWWLWLAPSFAGLMIVLASPLFGWLLHRQRGAVPEAAASISNT